MTQPDTSTIEANRRWFADAQKKCEERNARLQDFLAHHPQQCDESGLAYMARLCRIRMREQFPSSQTELFGDYERGGVYDYQND